MKLQELPFQVLTALLEHPGEVVTRDELRNKLWPADTRRALPAVGSACFHSLDSGFNTTPNSAILVRS